MTDKEMSFSEFWATTLMGRHPQTFPGPEIPRDLSFFFIGEGIPYWRSETWLWEYWLEKCRKRQAQYPDSLYAAEMVCLAEAALAYRATIPPDQVFWKPDRRAEGLPWPAIAAWRAPVADTEAPPSPTHTHTRQA